MFVFGTQYLRGASPERDQWERDLYNIKESGFNTIRAWMVWNAVEKAEGEIDYDYITSFLDCAKRNELDVGLLFHMHACPAWAMKKYSKYFYVNEDNLPFEPAVRPNTPSGGWPGLCFDHPEVRDMERRFIEGVIAETKKHSNVAFYEPMNEPHQWVDYQKSPSGIFCYCDASVAAFQQWLKEKYHDIGTLNAAWGHFYGSFDEIRPTRWTTSFADLADFRLFTMDNVAREIRYRTEIIRGCDIKPVIAHAWGGGTVTCSQLGGMAFDDWKNAEVFDKWGYSAFPNTADDCASLGLGCEATRCAANGKDYWQSELTAGIVGTGITIKERMDDNTFDKFSLESIRHGAKGLLYWQWRRERFGAEWAGNAMADYDGGPTRTSIRAAALCKAVTQNSELFCEGTQKEAQVALLFSRRSYLADWCDSWKAGNKFAVDSISGYYKMFWEENIAVDILHEEYLTDLSKYRVIIIPSPYAVGPDFAEHLRKYVEQGGTMISDPFFGAFDKDFKLSYHVPGFGFDQVFGCQELEMRETNKITLTDGKETLRIEGNRQHESFRDITADVLYRTLDGTPVILSNQYGKGTAVISGINLGLSYSDRALISDDFTTADRSNNSLAAKKIIMDICRQKGVEGNICTAPDVKVSVLYGKDGKEDLVILINSAHKTAEGKVLNGRIYQKYNVVYGNAQVSVSEEGFSFTLAPDESTIVRLSD